MNIIKGVILIGGPSSGTRFRPLSMDIPKPLFPIAGFPMIYHHVSALAKVPGMKEIVLIGFHDQSILDRFLTEVQIEFSHISIRYLREYKALGTAGGLMHFHSELMRGNPSHMIVMNADICCSFPLENMLLHLNRHPKAVACVLSTAVDKDEVHKYGCIVVNSETTEVIHFVEKPKSFVSDLISCGVYVFRVKIFDTIRKALDKKRNEYEESREEVLSHVLMSPRTKGLTLTLEDQAAYEEIQIEKDVLTQLVNSEMMYAFVCDPKKDFFMQIKTPTAVIPANKLYLQHFRRNWPKKLSISSAMNTEVNQETEIKKTAELIQPVMVHPTAIVHPSAKIGPNVTIGPRALVSRGVRISNSIVLDGAEIKNDACVMNSIVGWESKIGSWTRVEGAPGDANHLNATYKGLKIPTATVLGRQVTVGDELVVRNCIVLPHKDLNDSYHNEILM